MMRLPQEEDSMTNQQASTPEFALGCRQLMLDGLGRELGPGVVGLLRLVEAMGGEVQARKVV
jgi:hypothetical protein